MGSDINEDRSLELRLDQARSMSCAGSWELGRKHNMETRETTHHTVCRLAAFFSVLVSTRTCNRGRDGEHMHVQAQGPASQLGHHLSSRTLQAGTCPMIIAVCEQ